MANLLQATAIGRLTKDPFEPQNAKKNDPYALLSIAVNHGSGEEETTTFIDVAVFGKQAETILNTLVKGDEVLVIGRAELRSFEDKSGGEKTVLKISASTVQFLKVRAWEKGEGARATRNDDEPDDRGSRNGNGRGGGYSRSGGYNRNSSGSAKSGTRRF